MKKLIAANCQPNGSLCFFSLSIYQSTSFASPIFHKILRVKQEFPVLFICTAFNSILRNVCQTKTFQLQLGVCMVSMVCVKCRNICKHKNELNALCSSFYFHQVWKEFSYMSQRNVTPTCLVFARILIKTKNKANEQSRTHKPFT